MRPWHHRVRIDVAKAGGDDLLLAKARCHDVTQAASSPHAHGIPRAKHLHVALTLAHQHHRLVVRRRICIAAHSDQQIICRLAIRHDGADFADAAGLAIALHRTNAGAHRTAYARFGRHGSDHTLVLDQFFHVILKEGCGSVPDHASHLNLMHGKHHGS